MTDRLGTQLAFLNEIEKLKLVARHNRTVDGARFENSAEHSWHVALMALLLAEHTDTSGINLFKVVKMLLIHDLVEIDAGDTWLYDTEATQNQAERERQSATRLFGLLPADQAAELQALWEEFEARVTPEARYAAAIDALQPLANYLLSPSADPPETRPKHSEVLQRKQHIATGSGALWTLAQELIAESTQKGLYHEG